jgi:hypothetical protein
VIESKLPDRVVKNVMRMDIGGERFPVKVNKDPFYED